MTASTPRVSVAIALFNEEEVFPQSLRRVTAVLDDLPGGPHEIVFVDDGSTDRTFDLVTDASMLDERVVGLGAFEKLRSSGGVVRGARERHR